MCAYLIIKLIDIILFYFSKLITNSTVAITWTNAPENQYPIAGTNYPVKCEVTANPAPTVDWLRNGDPVSLFIHTYICIHIFHTVFFIL